MIVFEWLCSVLLSFHHILFSVFDLFVFSSSLLFVFSSSLLFVLNQMVCLTFLYSFFAIVFELCCLHLYVPLHSFHGSHHLLCCFVCLFV
jgi:purine-cytosine permease-like protein